MFLPISLGMKVRSTQQRNSTGNNCYSPDTPITARQWVVIICRALETNAELHSTDDFGMACLKYA